MPLPRRKSPGNEVGSRKEGTRKGSPEGHPCLHPCLSREFFIPSRASGSCWQLSMDVNNDSSLSKVDEKKIVVEFCQLQEKSRQLFNALRDLPQFGHKHWQTHFGKTFDVYTRLWKFQQKHRSILDSKYNLKRWQIGEIASKIGQLYYHYYLRTSEANYLRESFAFYSAIRSRAYYSQASKEEKSDLMVKKLRYYARFIVVSLLLNEIDLVKELIQELYHYVEEYVNVYEADDDEEWRLVISEVTAFMEADALVTVMTPDVVPAILSHRMGENEIPPQRPVGPTSFSLQEIIIVGTCEKQVKFSELTLDMFRMLQALEREPEEAPSRTLVTFTEETIGEVNRSSTQRPNPHKYLLYKPTFSQLYVFLACGVKELPNNGVMLVYISGDGCPGSAKAGSGGPYEMGGVSMSHKKVGKEEIFSKSVRATSDLFDVINHGSNDNAGPLLAFCHVCNIADLRSDLWDSCQRQVRRIMNDSLRIFYDWSRCVDLAFFQLLDDEFLRLMILRFIFCFYTMHLHRAFKGSDYYPKSFPKLSAEILLNGSLEKQVLELASMLDVRSLFYEVGEGPPID
ncbi:Protein SCAI [Acropora cervicornis]|uniref:Protein SCAI n=1 Tax=Acropora cervicornis TaxID=6130 RepID=A0AAD9QRR8_ACRCE|nr:Protein SCAI [Acropora cervicornis]